MELYLASYQLLTQFCQSYSHVVQFRNFIVHRYESVDTAILCDIVNNHITDVVKFKKEIESYVKTH